MLCKNIFKVIGLVGLLVVTLCCVADLGHDGKERKGKKQMGTYHTFDTTFATNRWPALLQSASGRYHAVNYYDDGMGVLGLVHSYRDDPTDAWTVMGSIHNALVAVSGPALFEEDADDPNPGRIHCFFADAGGTNDIMDMYSDDDGLTWSVPAVFRAAPAGFNQPVLIRVLRTDTRRWLFAVSQIVAVNDYEFYTFYTEDGGVNFSSTILHNVLYMSRPEISLTQVEHGKVYISYQYDPNTVRGATIALPNQLIHFAYSLDRGDNWRSNHVVADDLGGAYRPWLVPLDNGNILCAYETGAPVINMKRSTDGGYSWGAAVLLAANATSPCLAQLNNGVVVLIYSDGVAGVSMIQSNDRGVTWGAPVVLAVGCNASTLLYANDVLYCFYSHGFTNELRVIKSNDNGVSWSVAVTINTPLWASAPGYPCQCPNGDILCMWDENFYAISSDQGATWSAPYTLPAIAGVLYQVEKSLVLMQNVRTGEARINLLVSAQINTGAYPVICLQSTDNGLTWRKQDAIMYDRDSLVNRIWTHVIQAPLGHLMFAAVFMPDGVNAKSYVTHAPYLDVWDDAPKIDSYLSTTRVTSHRLTLLPNGLPALWWLADSTLEVITASSSDFSVLARRPSTRIARAHGTLVFGGVLTDAHGSFIVEGVIPGDILRNYPGFPNAATEHLEVSGVLGPTQLTVAALPYNFRPDSPYEILRRNPYTVYSGNHTITPVEGLHDFLFDADDDLTHVYVLDGTSTLASWHAEWEKDEKLHYGFQTSTALETPQILTRWTSRASEIASGADGSWAAYTFGSAGATFLADVEIGDRVVLTATGDVLTVVGVNSDVQLETLETGAMGPGLAYEVWRDLPDEVELNRREYEYANDRDAEGQRVFRRFPELPSDNAYFADFGFEVSAPASLDTLAYFYSLDAGIGGEFALAQKGDQVILSDPTAPGIKGQYTVDILGSANVVSVREFFNYADTSAENQVWRGPQPYRTYYYTLFVEKVRPETIFGPQVDMLQDWCYAGGDDANAETHNFKTKLWEMVPKIYRDRDAHKLTSAPDQVGEYGELHYRDTADFTAGHLERVARMFGHFLQRGRDLIDAFMAMWYPPAAPPEVLDDLTTMLGGETNRLLEALPMSRRRQFLKIFRAACQRKGRREALIRIARFYGYELEIDRPLLRRTLDSAALIEQGEDGRTTAANWFDAYRASGAGDGDTIIGTGTFQSLTGFFTTSGVKAGDVLTVLGGADAGDYTVVTADSLVQLTVDPVFPNGSVGQNWEVHAVTPDVAPGDFLYIRDPVNEDENGAWVLFTVGKYGHDLEVELPWTAAPLTGLAWEIRQGYPFDSEVDLDSWSESYAYSVKVRFYREGVYQLWEHEDTQLVFNLIRKFLPFRITPVYDQEVA